MATITVRVDDDVKQKAEIVLDDIGLNVTTLFNACLKALVREQRVPFELVSNEYANRTPNETTLKAMHDAENDIDLRKFDNADEMFGALGI